MARPNSMAQRNLTLTEELEKLEQQITLTLQEIDHNFSRAHRIVTSSILPIVENYREHSTSVWEGSQFWKQFFEASANVSLSGYEEPPPEGDEDDETISKSPSASSQTTPSTSTYASPPQADDDVTITPSRDQSYSVADPISPSPSQLTPRPHTKSKIPVGNPAPYSSPYESLKRETFGAESSTSPSDSPTPSTPRGTSTSRTKGHNVPAASSPFAPPSTYRRPAAQRTPGANNNNNNNDVLLHRVLDKNWRIQATPHSVARAGPSQYSTTRAAGRGGDPQTTPRPGTARRAQQQQQQQRYPSAMLDDDDLDSSPAAPAPELHSEIFDTPARIGRVPGVSVLTPARVKGGFGGGGGGRFTGTGKKKQVEDADGDDAPLGTAYTTATGQNASSSAYKKYGLGKDDDPWYSDDDEDDFGGVMSPPKTMQFHVPQSRLVRTPAREASKRIVEDLLSTAGMRDGLDEEERRQEEEDSPSIVKRGVELEEDTF